MSGREHLGRRAMSGLRHVNTISYAPSPLSSTSDPAQPNIPNLADDSEFPSLSGAPQSQQQNTSSQGIWNPSLRGPPNPNAPIGRPNQPSQNNGSSSSTQPQPQSQPPLPHQGQTQHHSYQQQGPEHPPDPGSSSLQSSNNNIGDPSFDHNPTTARGSEASPDDFPPLGGLGNADVNGRRLRPGQGNQFGGLGGPGPYLSSHSRGGALGQTDVHTEGLSQSGLGNRIMSPSAVHGCA